MYALNDNIVALATSPGSSALNIIRCSGPNVVVFLKKIIQKKTPPSHSKLVLRSLINPKTKQQIDRSLVVFFKGPKSYTGDDVVEFSVHGGSVIADKVIRVLIELGCREALPGEFTYRAFINGKVDLIQAEAINSIINANKEINAFYALKNIDGLLSGSLEKIKEMTASLITYIEHELDFTEEEIDHVPIKEYCSQIQKIIDAGEKINASSFVGNEKKTDIEVCIVGKPNAGKSSLFNFLVGKERSIVTRVSGTTRDFVSASFSLNDIVVDFVDTAGIRKTKNHVERKGIEKTFEKIKQSDIILFISSKSPAEEFKELNINTNKSQKIIFIQNKIDKRKKIEGSGIFHISCKNKKGLTKLQTELLTLIDKQKRSFYIKNKYLISRRAKEGLCDFVESLKKCKKTLQQNKDLVVFVSSLYFSLDKISDTLSPTNKNDILNKIFKGFCVGK